MANLIRSARSGSKWTQHDLTAYRINVVPTTLQNFFGIPAFPALPVTYSQAILLNLNHPPPGPIPLSEQEEDFFMHMSNVEDPRSTESSVDAFFLWLYSSGGPVQYSGNGRGASQKRELRFWMSGEKVFAKNDIYLWRQLGYRRYVLVQENKELGSQADPEPQLIAEAIAAFSENNEALVRSGANPLPFCDIPGITVVGTAPTFYLIRVTTNLIKALERARLPAQATIVKKYTPPVPNPQAYLTDGMRPLANRYLIFQCLEALRALINSLALLASCATTSHNLHFGQLSRAHTSFILC